MRHSDQEGGRAERRVVAAAACAPKSHRHLRPPPRWPRPALEAHPHPAAALDHAQAGCCARTTALCAAAAAAEVALASDEAQRHHCAARRARGRESASAASRANAVSHASGSAAACCPERCCSRAAAPCCCYGVPHATSPYCGCAAAAVAPCRAGSCCGEAGSPFNVLLFFGFGLTSRSQRAMPVNRCVPSRATDASCDENNVFAVVSAA